MLNKQAMWLLLTMPLLLGGCATLSEGECHSEDWRELGRSDGAHGFAASRLGEHVEACGKYGVTPDADAYRAGRLEGLQQYCQPQNAVSVGRSGGTYRQVCPADSDAMFVQFYNRGTVLRAMDTDMQELQGALNDQRAARGQTQDLRLYKMLDENIRYLERRADFLHGALDRAQQDVAAGRDPEFYAAGDWHSDLPNPGASEEVRKEQERAKQKQSSGH
ncbi:MAG: DUF2799 domain-containing protein [Stenotrophobium sp.]